MKIGFRWLISRWTYLRYSPLDEPSYRDQDGQYSDKKYRQSDESPKSGDGGSKYVRTNLKDLKVKVEEPMQQDCGKSPVGKKDYTKYKPGDTRRNSFARIPTGSRRQNMSEPESHRG